MVTDYERAWIELAALVASKTQHGREALLVEMAQIGQRCQVPAGELSRLLRLYGVEVERTRSVAVETDRQESGAFEGGLASSSDRGLSGHHRTEEVHDGSSNGFARAGRH